MKEGMKMSYDRRLEEKMGNEWSGRKGSLP
jgi:hypothetical protein